MGLEVTITSTLLTKRGISQIQRLSNRITALEMRANLENRFKGPRRGQKHKRRSAGYNKRKRRQVGHIKPLLLTGAMRKSVLTKARVTATAKQGRVITTTGAKGFRSGEWRQMVRDELEQVPMPEEKKLAKEKLKTIGTLSKQTRFMKKTTSKKGRR